MLNATKAFEQWQGVRSLLAELQAHVAAHPSPLAPVPEHLGIRMNASLRVLTAELASPQPTWKKLLQKKVACQVLTACCELMATFKHAAIQPAACCAALLLQRAAAALPPVTAGRSSSGTTSTSTTSSSSRLSLSDMLWEQLEQSGLLQHLPDALGHQAVHNHLADGMQAGRLGSDIAQTAIFLCEVLLAAQQLRPGFLAESEAGQACVLPAMQLGLASLQLISTVCQQEGRQEWMEMAMGKAWNAASAAAPAAGSLFRTLADRPPGRSSTASSGSSAASVSAAAGLAGGSSDSHRPAGDLAVLKAEQTVQWVCLEVVVRLAVQYLVQATADNAHAGGASSSGSGCTSEGGSAAVSSSRAPATGSCRAGRQQPAAGRASAGEQWLPAVLAPGLPAAYSTMLEQLGCSREVVLWLAVLLRSGNEKPSPAETWGWLLDGAQIGLQQYEELWGAWQLRSVIPTQLAALHLSMSAVTIQWLSDTPPDRLLGMQEGCPACCHVAAAAWRHGIDLLPQLEEQQAVGCRALALTTRQTVLQSGMPLLTKLLDMCRARVAHNSTAGGSGGSSGEASILLQSCVSLVGLVAHAFAHTAAEVVSPAQRSARCCKLLQGCVRLVLHELAADAAAPSTDSDSDFDFDSSGRLCVIFEALGLLLLGARVSSSSSAAVAPGSPLAALAAGGVSSASALEVFGLLCSTLKVYQAADFGAVEAAYMCALDIPNSWDFVSEVLPHAVGSMLNAALASSLSGGEGAGSSNVAPTTVLPWLVLLGRYCLACGVMVQYWQTESPGFGGLVEPSFWGSMHYMGQHLGHVSSIIAGVVRWLAAAGTVQQLAALGYRPQELQQQLAQTAEALATLTLHLSAIGPDSTDANLVGTSYAAALLSGIHQQLQAAGRVLTCFAIPHACNNPACVNGSGPSEARLVGGRGCICSGCRTARYCGKACQRQAWSQHKPICRALAAAAASAAAASAAGAAADPPA